MLIFPYPTRISVQGSQKPPQQKQVLDGVDRLLKVSLGLMDQCFLYHPSLVRCLSRLHKIYLNFNCQKFFLGGFQNLVGMTGVTRAILRM